MALPCCTGASACFPWKEDRFEPSRRFLSFVNSLLSLHAAVIPVLPSVFRRANSRFTPAACLAPQQDPAEVTALLTMAAMLLHHKADTSLVNTAGADCASLISGSSSPDVRGLLIGGDYRGGWRKQCQAMGVV